MLHSLRARIGIASFRKSSLSILAQNHLTLLQTVRCSVLATYWTSSLILLCPVASLIMCIFLISLWEWKPFLWKLESDSLLPSTCLQCPAQCCIHSGNILSIRLEVLGGEHGNLRTLGQGIVPSLWWLCPWQQAQLLEGRMWSSAEGR